LTQLQALKDSPTMPAVRPPWNDMVTFKRLLDLGAQTLIVPYVQNAQEARNAVAYTRYPPHGVRGFAGSPRASGYGRIKDYAKRCTDEICLLIQIETLEGLKHLEDIASIDGVDGIFIGPGDLSADMGYLGQPSHPEVVKVVEDGFKRILACGKAPGILVGGDALTQHYLDIGGLFVAVGADQNVLRDGVTQLAARFKA
jgi:4-hydroxy-2-oxoheptanedioate aldolase